VSQVSKPKTVGRVVFLVFLLATTMGPWFATATRQQKNRALALLHPVYALLSGWVVVIAPA